MIERSVAVSAAAAAVVSVAVSASNDDDDDLRPSGVAATLQRLKEQPLHAPVLSALPPKSSRNFIFKDRGRLKLDIGQVIKAAGSDNGPAGDFDDFGGEGGTPTVVHARKLLNDGTAARRQQDQEQKQQQEDVLATANKPLEKASNQALTPSLPHYAPNPNIEVAKSSSDKQSNLSDGGSDDSARHNRRYSKFYNKHYDSSAGGPHVVNRPASGIGGRHLNKHPQQHQHHHRHRQNKVQTQHTTRSNSNQKDPSSSNPHQERSHPAADSPTKPTKPVIHTAIAPPPHTRPTNNRGQHNNNSSSSSSDGQSLSFNRAFNSPRPDWTRFGKEPARNSIQRDNSDISDDRKDRAEVGEELPFANRAGTPLPLHHNLGEKREKQPSSATNVSSVKSSYSSDTKKERVLIGGPSLFADTSSLYKDENDCDRSSSVIISSRPVVNIFDGLLQFSRDEREGNEKLLPVRKRDVAEEVVDIVVEGRQGGFSPGAKSISSSNNGGGDFYININNNINMNINMKNIYANRTTSNHNSRSSHCSTNSPVSKNRNSNSNSSSNSSSNSRPKSAHLSNNSSGIYFLSAGFKIAAPTDIIKNNVKEDVLGSAISSVNGDALGNNVRAKQASPFSIMDHLVEIIHEEHFAPDDSAGGGTYGNHNSYNNSNNNSSSRGHENNSKIHAANFRNQRINTREEGVKSHEKTLYIESNYDNISANIASITRGVHETKTSRVSANITGSLQHDIGADEHSEDNYSLDEFDV